MIYFDFDINGCKLVNQTSSRYFLNNLKLYIMKTKFYPTIAIAAVLMAYVFTIVLIVII